MELSKTTQKLLRDNRTVPLEDVAKSLWAAVVSIEPGEQVAAECFLVDRHDFHPNGYCGRPANKVAIPERLLGTVESGAVKGGDILLPCRPVTLSQPALVAADPDALWYPTQTIRILRMRACSPINAIILHRYLSSRVGQELLNAAATRNSRVPYVPVDALRALPVIVPDDETVSRIMAAHDALITAHQELERVQRRIAALRDEPWLTSLT
jgi:hypothetical protein